MSAAKVELWKVVLNKTGITCEVEVDPEKKRIIRASPPLQKFRRQPLANLGRFRGVKSMEKVDG